MKLLVVSQYFWPENFRINELVRSLVENSVEVDVLTGKPNYPEGSIHENYRASGCVWEKWSGVNVYRVPIIPRGYKKPFKLLLNYLSFITSSMTYGALAMSRRHQDVILVYGVSPLLQALPALFIGWIKRIPVVLYVQDLWPESLEATGYIRNRLILGVVSRVVKFIYRHSDLILISSRPFDAAIARFSPTADMVYFPNSVDESFCDPNSGFKPEVPALDQGFCVVFAGNVGAAQAVHVITEAAILLSDHSNIRLIILGGGSEIESMQANIKSSGLNNLYLAGRFSVECMPYLLSRASALLVTLADKDIFSATVPNKIQAYMAVGRPIIASVNGEGARIIEEAGAGFAVPAENSRALADCILKLSEMSEEERCVLGENGQKYYRTHFDHNTLVLKLIDHLKTIIAK